MDTTRSSVSRLERMGPSVPSVTTLCRYAEAIDCRLAIRFVPKRQVSELPVWLREKGDE
jgi:transcriptional regulator with XRE-family HTH domain